VAEGVGQEWLDNASAARDASGNVKLGGWKSVLEVRAHVRGTVQDRRQTFAHIFHVPVIPFNLRAGGIGFINPTNLTCATAYPPPDSLPETALPLEFRRWTPSQCRISAGLAGAVQP
jgi:hypothetical protein